MALHKSPSRKGPSTRQVVLSQATDLATRIGLQALSFSTLAAAAGLSKSGLYAHFQSKEELQLAIVESAGAQFQRRVIEPSLMNPRGEPRVLGLIHRWSRWSRGLGSECGCFFMQATAEFDDQPGPIRDALQAQQRDWIEFLAGAAERAVEVGHFRLDLDPRQFSFELHGIYMAHHHAHRLLGDPDAHRRFEDAVSELIQRSRSKNWTGIGIADLEKLYDNDESDPDDLGDESQERD